MLTVSAKTESFPSAYWLNSFSSTDSPNQSWTRIWAGILGPIASSWGYCQRQSPINTPPEDIHGGCSGWEAGGGGSEAPVALAREAGGEVGHGASPGRGGHRQRAEHFGDGLEALQSPGGQGFCVSVRHPSGLGHQTQPTYFSKNRKNKQGDVSLPFFLSLSHFFSPSSDASFPSRAKVQKKPIYFGSSFAASWAWGFGVYSVYFISFYFFRACSALIVCSQAGTQQKAKEISFEM